MGINVVVVSGTLGVDPELRYTNSGMAIANIRFAHDRYIKTDDGWDKQTYWFNAFAFGKKAERVCATFHKGDPVVIQGQLRSRTYESKTGETRAVVEVLVDKVLKEDRNAFLNDNGGDTAGARANNVGNVDDDDVPF